MRPRLIAASLLCTTLLASAALAQNQTPPPANQQQPLGTTDSGQGSTQLLTQQANGGLRISDLMGRDVIGPNNEDVGEIEDIVLDHSGRIAAVVIETDGALGFGDREIAVPIHALRIDPVDTTVSTGTIRGAGLPASTAEGQQVRDESRISRILSPDKIMLTMPVDQLRSAPAFSDDDD